MSKGPIRVYADTSVFGGVFDEEFQQASRVFFDQVRGGRFLLLTSGTVEEEIEGAPVTVREFFVSMAPWMHILESTEETLALRVAYLEAGILSPKSAADALHVATATTGGASMIVSWNFVHLVHFDKIRLYNAVNALKGFGEIAIYSPPEVVRYENENI